jgi:hypothetical protein
MKNYILPNPAHRVGMISRHLRKLENSRGKKWRRWMRIGRPGLVGLSDLMGGWMWYRVKVWIEEAGVGGRMWNIVMIFPGDVTHSQ